MFKLLLIAAAHVALTTAFDPVAECTHHTDPKGMRYQGTTSWTASGKECQDWTAQSPHQHADWDALLVGGAFTSYNFCRNPDKEPRPWCYTTDPDTRWELCDIPDCGGCTEPDDTTGAYYQGTVAETESGLTCQAWADQSPHSHPDFGLSGDANYCRNPDGEPRPWCYTTDSAVRWEMCHVPVCEEMECLTEDDPTGAAYGGSKWYTGNGRQCQPWSSQSPHSHSDFDSELVGGTYGAQDFCRNPDGEPAPWCYTLDSSTRWELCDIPNCVDCIHVEDITGATYGGTVSYTKTGKTCQPWAEQSPHEHMDFGDALIDGEQGASNYCRNPDGESAPWCYTTDANSRWELCDIPDCSM